MQRTLFVIPHEWLGIPLFGVGWALALWLLIGGLTLYRQWRAEGWSPETRGLIVTLLMLGGAIVFVVPWLELRVDDRPAGVPIRGYGAMLLLGVVSGVLLAVYRARRMGVDPEVIYSLFLWVFVAGIAGARLFFVVQYWDNFRRPTLIETASEVLKFTEGGLVVYGAFFGCMAAVWWFSRQRRVPMLALADLIAPSLLIGLAFGRIGCLMNGCCYGGLCHDGGLSIRFPADSPPYLQQLEEGRLHGVAWTLPSPDRGMRVFEVAAGSPAANAGLKVGDQIEEINGAAADRLSPPQLAKLLESPSIAVSTRDGRTVRWSVEALPAHSLPVQPAQVYSSVGAALLCLVLLAYYPFRRHDGDVFALLLTLYGIQRFLEELIREDEPGRLGTPFSVGQLVSLLVVGSSVWLWWYLSHQPRGSCLPPREAISEA